MTEIWGKIHIHDGGWSVVLPGQMNNNEQQLMDEVQYINKVNPRFGQSICRHIKNADKCEMYLDNETQFVKCIVLHQKMNNG